MQQKRWIEVLCNGPYGTNAETYDGRPGFIQDGFNFQGDKNGSK